jgi:GTP cyclohydrolase I
VQQQRLFDHVEVVAAEQYREVHGSVTPAEQIQLHLWKILELLQLDTSSEHFLETPRRVTDMLLEFRQEVDLVALLKNGFENNEGDAMVVQQEIPIAGLCAHHLAPWTGTAHIGYLPHRKICGLSKLTRVAQAAGKREPSTQERVTNDIANAIHKGLDAKGVIVVTRATHGCMAARGVNQPSVVTSVSAVRGLFLVNPAAREEFFEVLKIGR